jgi:hypothetical protein
MASGRGVLIPEGSHLSLNFESLLRNIVQLRVHVTKSPGALLGLSSDWSIHFFSDILHSACGSRIRGKGRLYRKLQGDSFEMSVVDRAAHIAAARASGRLPGAGADVQTVLSGLLRVGDVSIVLGASFFAYWIWHGSLDLPSFYVTPTLLGALLAANFLHWTKVYSAEALRRPALQAGKAVAAWMAASAGLVAIAYLTSTSIIYSRGWALLWLVLTPLGFIVARGFAVVRVARWRRMGLLSTRVAVIGAGELAEAVARQLEDAPDQQYRVVGFFAEPGAEPLLLPSRGGIDELVAAVAANQVD